MDDPYLRWCAERDDFDERKAEHEKDLAADELGVLLLSELEKARNYATKEFRHVSHRDYAVGIADGWDAAYALWCKHTKKDLTQRK
jgi:hypothetical protein